MTFYAELFGWELAGPGEMPGDPPGRYFVARLRGRDIGGIGSQPTGQASAPAGVEHLRLRRRAPTRPRRRAVDAGGTVSRAVRRPAGRSHGRARRPGGRAVLRVAARPAHGRAARQRARGVGHEPPHDPGSRARRRVLWRPLRLDDRDLRRGRLRHHHVPPARLRRRRAPAAGPREVVATMSGASGDGAPGWGVNLWDRDVDATVAGRWSSAAARVATPFDTPMSRMARAGRPARCDVQHQHRAGVARRCSIIPPAMHVDAAIAPDLSHPGRRGPARARRRAARPRARAVTRIVWRSCSRAAACAASSRPHGRGAGAPGPDRELRPGRRLLGRRHQRRRALRRRRSRLRRPPTTARSPRALSSTRRACSGGGRSSTSPTSLAYDSDDLDAERHERAVASPIALHCVAVTWPPPPRSTCRGMRSKQRAVGRDPGLQPHAVGGRASGRVRRAGASSTAGWRAPIPVAEALAAGATHVLALQTRPYGVPRKSHSRLADRFIERHLRELNPALVTLYRARVAHYETDGRRHRPALARRRRGRRTSSACARRPGRRWSASSSARPGHPGAGRGRRRAPGRAGARVRAAIVAREGLRTPHRGIAYERCVVADEDAD